METSGSSVSEIIKPCSVNLIASTSNDLQNSVDSKIIVDKYVKTLQISEETAIMLAKATKGYSFAFQTIGYYAWEYPDHLKQALQNAKEYLFEFAYQKIWSELSANDRDVVRAIYQSKTGEIIHVRKILNWTSNQFNPYRDRLIKAGVISGPQNGYVELALPWFGEYAMAVFDNIN